MTLLQTVEANWLIFAAMLVIAVILAFWLFGRAGKPTVRERRPDVLDEGAAPAQRNQALIDAPPAAATMPAPIVPAPVTPVPAALAPVTPPAAAGTFAGIGEVIADGAQDEVQAAQPAADLPGSEQSVPPPSGSDEQADDLRRIKGVGPKLLATLHALGITSYAQIAAWTDADLDALDAQLGAFAGRPRRDSWVEQAQLLAGGDTGAYEAKFGKL